jgi:hypothetical protein
VSSLTRPIKQDSKDQEISGLLERRLGRTYARQRLGIERDHEQRVFGEGINFFHIENWYLSPTIIRNALRLVGLYGRGQRNAERVEVRENIVRSHRVPLKFDGFTILHISDMHVDMNEGAMHRLRTLLPELSYDICVLTGDYRGKTFGPFDAALEGLADVRSCLTGPVYGVLGNHDTICMVPGLESMGYECCSMRTSRLGVRVSASILPVSMTLITTVSIISRKRLLIYLGHFLSYFLIRLKYIVRRLMPVSTSY